MLYATHENIHFPFRKSQAVDRQQLNQKDAVSSSIKIKTHSWTPCSVLSFLTKKITLEHPMYSEQYAPYVSVVHLLFCVTWTSEHRGTKRKLTKRTAIKRAAATGHAASCLTVTFISFESEISRRDQSQRKLYYDERCDSLRVGSHDIDLA